MSYTKPMFKTEDARRMARTCIAFRKEREGENIPKGDLKYMGKMQAGLLAAFAARPASARTVELRRADRGAVVLHLGAGR